MIHDRMPMIIDSGSWSDWLDPANTDVADLRALLTPAMVSDLTTWPVSTEVNSVRQQRARADRAARPRPGCCS